MIYPEYKRSSKSYNTEDIFLPQWKARRSEILAKHGEKCFRCGTWRTDFFIVHHIDYIQGKRAWEYPDDMLIPLCDNCHKLEHGLSKLAYECLLLADFGEITPEIRKIVAKKCGVKTDLVVKSLKYASKDFLFKDIKRKGKLYYRPTNFIYLHYPLYDIFNPPPNEGTAYMALMDNGSTFNLGNQIRVPNQVIIEINEDGVQLDKAHKDYVKIEYLKIFRINKPIDWIKLPSKS
jgi:hypothetical protein